MRTAPVADRRVARYDCAIESWRGKMQTADIQPHLARVDAAIAASTTRLEKAKASLQKAADELARDLRQFETSQRLLGRVSGPNRS
jgi:hypothetical protein